MSRALEKLIGPGWLGHGLAVLAGALGVFGFAPYSLWPLLALSGVLLLLLTEGLSARAAGWRAFFWAFGFYAVGINWVHVSIHVFGGAPLPLALLFVVALAAYMALYPGLVFAALGRWFPDVSTGRYLLAFPALWLFQEAFRGWFMTGFPWLFFGYSQLDGPLAGFAPVAGVYGVSYGVALGLGGVFLAGRTRRILPLAVPILLGLTGLALARIDWTRPEGPAFSVSLVQGNIPQEVKWNRDALLPTLTIYSDLTREHWNSDLIVWPEAAIPALKEMMQPYLDSLSEEAKSHQTSLVIGMPSGERGTRRYYNSAFVLGVGSGLYSKQHLVPFGEFVPFEGLLRGLIQFFDLPMSGFSPGQKGIVLQTKKASLNPAICYEIAYPIQVAQVDADVLLTVSNDAWFGHSIGPNQHMQIARMRALENGRYLLRSTNNGITAIVDEKGRFVARLPQFTRAVLRGEARRFSGRTPFAATLGIPVFVLAGLLLAVASWRRRG